MRFFRILLSLLGLAALAWGVVLVVPLLLGPTQDTVSLVIWLASGPILHDALIAPCVGLLGLLLTRFLKPAWRTPISIGLIVTGVIMLLAVPALWRTEAGPANPGLHDRDYAAGLIITLLVLWLGVLVMSLVRAYQARTRAPAE